MIERTRSVVRIVLFSSPGPRLTSQPGVSLRGLSLTHWAVALLTQGCSNRGRTCRLRLHMVTTYLLIHSYALSKYLLSVVYALGIALSTGIHEKGNGCCPHRASSIVQEQNRADSNTIQ